VDVKKRSKRTIFQIQFFVPKALSLLNYPYCNCSFFSGGSIASFCLQPKVKEKTLGKIFEPKDNREHQFFFYTRRYRFKLSAF